MPVRAEVDKNGVWTVSIQDEPPWVSIIDRQNQDNVSSIASGIHIFVAFSLWKVADYDLVFKTIRLVPSDGRVRVRIYGYDYATELDTIYPFNALAHHDNPIISHYSHSGHSELMITGDSTTSPIWMIYLDGRLITTSQGVEGLKPVENELNDVF